MPERSKGSDLRSFVLSTRGFKSLTLHIFYFFKKGENKDDNKGIKLIKEFVETLYKEMTEERNKRK